MVIGPKKLLELVKNIKLVTNLSERELTNPEGAGFDLRLGEIYKISGESFLGVTERKTADIELVQKYEEGKTNKVTILPGDFFLTKTIEDVNMPNNLTASITPRSTTYRSGLVLRTGNVPPGYCGGLTFGLHNAGPVPVTIEMGARFVHIQFHEVLGEGNMYRGQWQGGRVTATKKEKQV
ncbi:2'-deoxycytidine 5'-triphosphate deaminase [Candidatus Microgenomates bacterium]|nr:2'-deoxycytidine 5'-triphosphate deaminase [Candidatus Microgenomates bacterium]